MINQDIYKVCLISSNRIKKEVIVFHEKVEKIFSDDELETIEKEKIKVSYSTQQIHKDDSIRTIKNKIIKELGFDVSYKELYLFCQIQENISLYEIYHKVTKFNEEPFTLEMLKQFDINLEDSVRKKIKPLYQTMLNDRSYTYDELKNIIELNDKVDISIPFGQKFKNEKDYLFPVNPFDKVKTEENKIVLLNPLENSLLLSNGKLVENTIFVCFAQEVLQYSNEIGIDEKYMIQQYYPYLYSSNIYSLSNLLENKQKLIKETKNKLNEHVWKLYETVDLFYDIYYNNKNDDNFNYYDDGIQKFHVILKTGFLDIVPLDAIFKNIHATENVPFIKYNPGLRQENILRLYTDKISKNGKKIPVLNDTTVSKLSKEIGKSEQVSLYVNYFDKSVYEFPVKIILDFLKDGNLSVKSTLTKPISSELLEKLLINALNPELEKINEFLEQTGFSIPIFESLKNTNIIVENLEYNMSLALVSLKKKNAIQLEKYRGCISVLFTLIKISNADLLSEEGAQMRFRRVDNYVELNEIDELILNERKYNDDLYHIVGLLISEFGLSEKDALNKVADFEKNRVIIDERILDNPGFSVSIKQSRDNHVHINIKNINSIEYLDILKIYFDSILRLFQLPESIKNDKISKLCNKKNETFFIEEVNRKDISLVVPVIEEKEDENQEDEIIFYDTDEGDDEQEEEDKEEEAVVDNIFDLEENKKKGEKGEQDEEDEEEEEEKGEQDEEDDDDIEFDLEEEEEKGEQDEDEDDDIEFDLEEEEDDDEDLKDMKGGDENDEYIEINVEGERLKNPNYFVERMKKYDEKIIKDFEGYSRKIEKKFIPVVITKEEKDVIDREHAGSYTNAKRSLVKDDVWYICPKYWDLKHNVSLSQSEVDELKKTNPNVVIPEGVIFPPKGSYVYDFSGRTSDFYPGFNKQNLPRCNKKDKKEKAKVNKAQEVEREEIENTDEVEVEVEVEENKTQVEVKDKKKVENNYILATDKFPVPENRWAFLPTVIQRLFNFNYKDVVEKNRPSIIKKNSSCLLTYGVENSQNKTFISCLADIYGYVNKKETPSIKEMINILSENISFDEFIRYYNGSLISVFKPKETNKNMNEIDIVYKQSNFYKSIEKYMNNNDTETMFKTAIYSYENFKEYLNNENESIIDHTYLWDVVCEPNKNLFDKEGFNLFIINTIVENNEKVELICPSGSLNDHFDKNRKTLILLKQNNIYHPIYLFKNIKRESSLKLFKMDGEQPELINQILEKLNKNLLRCSPRPSFPDEYNFDKPQKPIEIIEEVEKVGYIIKAQFINYQSKLVGFYVVDPTKKGFLLPCFPSSYIVNSKNKKEKYQVRKIESIDPKDYKTTVKFMREIYEKTNGKVKCDVLYKVFDSNTKKIVGVLTQTNQYIKVKPSNIEDDNIEVLYESEYIVAEKSIISKENSIDEKLSYIKMIEIESQFYSIFRSIIRVLMNRFENRNLKEKIIDEIKEYDKNKMDKKNLDKNFDIKQDENNRYIKNIEVLLKDIVKDIVIFVEFEDDTLDIILEITRCNSKIQNNYTQYCLSKKESGNEELIIPKYNLMNRKTDNSEYYYIRLADELLRFHRVRSFLIEPKKFLNFTDLEYRINNNEILLLESLRESYYSNLEVYNESKYINLIPFDFAEHSFDK